MLVLGPQLNRTLLDHRTCLSSASHLKSSRKLSTIWDLGSLTLDRALTPCSGGTESWPLEDQGSPCYACFIRQCSLQITEGWVVLVATWNLSAYIVPLTPNWWTLPTMCCTEAFFKNNCLKIYLFIYSLSFTHAALPKGYHSLSRPYHRISASDLYSSSVPTC